MDKNAIKKYAVWARTELIERVRQRALKYEVAVDADANAESASGKVMTDIEKTQRQAAIARMREKGYEYVIEEVAYTWFNRFAALRYMEVNNYLPTRVRVFTDENGAFKPQILAEAIHLNLDGLDMEKVYALKEAENNDELYKYLLITQCNALSAVLPQMFKPVDERCKEEKNDYTILLFPDNQLREGSVIEQMIEKIPEDNFDVNSENGQLEIIGWLYQYYISERHEEVVSISNKGAVKKDDIPAATQLFTTDWVVRYIVDNSVGRYWIERNPNSSLVNELEFYVKPKNATLLNEKSNMVSPEEITFFDPCIGSGHFAIYAFDVLMKIYMEYGYSQRDAVAAIVEKNIYGLDIDDRAAQLAYFSVMMKACQYDRRFFTRNIQPHIFSIAESNQLDSYCVDYFCNGDESLNKMMNTIKNCMFNAKEYGSLLTIPDLDFSKLHTRLEEIKEDINIVRDVAIAQIRPLIEVAEILSQKYAIVATNPPYLNRYNEILKEFVLGNYKDYSGDLFSVFMYHNFVFTLPDGYCGFMTPFVWMFIKSYEKLRDYLISKKSIATLIQFEYSAYEEATVPICTFVLKNKHEKTKGLYFKLSDFRGGMDVQRNKTLEAIINPECGYFYETDIANFSRINGHPIAFWASEKMLNAFENFSTIAELAPPKQGLATANNDLYLKLWFEPSIDKIGMGITSCSDAAKSGYKWFPYNKGGAFRRWFGNRDYVVNWENDGYEIKNFKDNKGKIRSRPQNLAYYFKQGITWSDITSASFSGRYTENGFIFDIKGSSGFPDPDKIYYILGFLNSSVSQKCIKILNPTITTQVGDMARIPVSFDESKKQSVDDLVRENISIAQSDWNSFETSWNFTKHPLLGKGTIIEDAYTQWERECSDRFTRLKDNEVAINRIFIELYGLDDEMSPSVLDKDVEVSCHHADKVREVKSLISFAVGCMFGRYSLNIEGLVYAGGVWDTSKYTTYFADKDNIIPICDDEYFEDDITGLFVKFIETAFGQEDLDKNIRYIADTLGGDGTPKEVIRDYFLSDKGFYADHCSTYSVSGSGKRPIYWLFDSGKKNGFKALVYMHRYQPDTIARMRTDYVHEQQSRYRTAITDLENRIADASTSERVRLNKQLTKLRDQSEEIRKYEEKIHHLADQYIAIDLDDGVKKNYEIFKDVLAKIK